MAQAPRGVDVPTQEEFDALKLQVEDHEARISALENGEPPETLTPSPDGTTVTDTNGEIVDAQLRTFKLTAAHRIDMDGVVSGGGVVRLYADGGKCYQENTDNDWWYMGDDDWVATTNPTGESPPQPIGTTFADEFTNTLSVWNPYSPDATKVWQRSRWYGPDWNGWACNDGWMVNPDNPATPKSDMYRIDNSNLILDVQRTPSNMLGACGNKKILTAQINTLSFKQLGGYWEAKIKAPNIPGTNMAFWLMNNKSWPPEVDIVEIVNHGDWILMSQNLWHTDHTTEPYYMFDNQGFTIDDWHTYGFWWDHANRRMQYFYDGHKTIDTAEPAGYTEPMFIICGSQQGGDWSGPIPDSAQLAPLRFEYVRCYERPPTDLSQTVVSNGSTRTRRFSDAQFLNAHMREKA